MRPNSHDRITIDLRGLRERLHAHAAALGVTTAALARATLMSLQAPFEVWIALPAGTHAPRINGTAIRVTRLSGAAFSEGIETVVLDRAPVRVYNLAKTITDCFKLRGKVGLDVALEALREGWKGRKVTMDELSRYAAVNRMSNVMRPYIEALTG